jgi:predicted ester cyclase
MRITIAVLAVIIAGACLQPGASAQNSGSPKTVQKADIAKAYVWFTSDSWDSLATLIASDFIDHDPDQGQKPGLDGLKAQFAQYRSTFPDMKLDLKDVLLDGDIAMTRVEITGTMNGKMGDMPPNGKKMDVQMFEKLRFKDGKMVERWGVFDSMKMMTQLGMMPPPGPPPAEKK